MTKNTLLQINYRAREGFSLWFGGFKATTFHPQTPGSDYLAATASVLAHPRSCWITEHLLISIPVNCVRRVVSLWFQRWSSKEGHVAFPSTGTLPKVCMRKCHYPRTMQRHIFTMMGDLIVSLASPDLFANVHYSGTFRFIFNFQGALSTGIDWNASWHNLIDLQPVGAVKQHSSEWQLGWCLVCFAAGKKVAAWSQTFLSYAIQ